MLLCLVVLFFLVIMVMWIVGVIVVVVGCVFNVLDFGVVVDGCMDDFEVFLSVWMEVCVMLGSLVVVVFSGDYLFYLLVFWGLCSGYVEVYVGGVFCVLLGFVVFCGCCEWVYFFSIDGLLVIGGGMFDGCGVIVWLFNECL